MLKNYEDDLSELKRKEKEIPEEDVITAADETRVIKEHLEEEQALERRAGRRYLTAIDSESDVLGSTLESVNRRIEEQSELDGWTRYAAAEGERMRRGRGGAGNM